MTNLMGAVLAICDLGSSLSENNLRGQCLRLAIGALQLMTHLGGTVPAICDLDNSLTEKKLGGTVPAICVLQTMQAHPWTTLKFHLLISKKTNNHIPHRRSSYIYYLIYVYIYISICIHICVHVYVYVHVHVYVYVYVYVFVYVYVYVCLCVYSYICNEKSTEFCGCSAWERILDEAPVDF